MHPGVCWQFGAFRRAPGSLVFRLAPDYMPEINRLYRALEQGDSRLIFSASREAALVFHEPKAAPEQLIKNAVPVLEKVLQKL